MKKGPHSPNLSPLVRVLNIPPLLVLMEVVEIQSHLYIRKMGPCHRNSSRQKLKLCRTGSDFHLVLSLLPVIWKICCFSIWVFWLISDYFNNVHKIALTSLPLSNNSWARAWPDEFLSNVLNYFQKCQKYHCNF